MPTSFAAAQPHAVNIPTQLAAPLTRPKPFPATVSRAYPPIHPVQDAEVTR